MLHSLAIARVLRPESGARILDVGTGGGFPGIPLAIVFPQAHFTLCDSIGKKIKVVNAVSNALGLGNVDGTGPGGEPHGPRAVRLRDQPRRHPDACLPGLVRPPLGWTTATDCRTACCT